MNQILKDAYFLIVQANDGRSVDYCEISYFRSEEFLLAYMKADFSGTDAKEILNYTVPQLLDGQAYEQSQRMGSGTVTTHVQVFHNSNLRQLYRLLDSVEIEDEDGERLYLSSYLKNAEDPEDIEEVISVFNEVRENYW